MRNSVQDLIQFGITTPGGPDLGSSGVASRSPSHARDTDPLGESLGFDTLLALAASLHRPATSPLELAVLEAKLGGLIGPPNGDQSQAGTLQGELPFDAPVAEAETPDGIAGRQAQIHDLFTGLASASEGPTLKKVQAVGLPAPAESQQDTDAGDAGLPIEFRPTRRIIPIHIDRAAETPGTGEQPREIDAGPQGPDLRIVARNDSPELSAFNDVLPITRRLPDLRLVVSNEPQPEINTDLVERLERGWRHSFAEDGIDLSDVETTATRLSGGAQPGPERPGGESEGSSHFSGSDDDAGPQRTVEHRSAPVVPLFGELMSAQRLDGGNSLDVEQPVDVRRAVVEISREVQRLERMGGTELSFSLRLHPEHLGQLEIDIQRSGDRWTVAITTADESARHALAAEMHRLENAFRDHNLSLDRLTIVARSPEPVIGAPDTAGQPSNPDWQGAGRQDFMGNGNQDNSEWQGYGRRGIIGIDSSRDVGAEQEVTRSHTETSRSGIDIHI